MSTMTPCPKDSPLTRAWEAYKATEEYANTKRWAVVPEHAEGSLWAAFEAGFRGSPAAPPSGAGREEDRSLADLLEGAAASIRIHCSHNGSLGPIYEEEARACESAAARLAEVEREKTPDYVAELEARVDELGGLAAKWYRQYLALARTVEGMREALEKIGDITEPLALLLAMDGGQGAKDVLRLIQQVNRLVSGVVPRGRALTSVPLGTTGTSGTTQTNEEGA